MNLARYIPVVGLTALTGYGLAANAQEPWRLDPISATGRVTYFIAEGMDGSRYVAADRDLASWALRAWAGSAMGALRFEPAPEAAAQVRVYWVPPGFGQYGEMRPLLVEGRRGAAVFVRPDTDALGEEIGQRAREDPLFRDTIVYLTCLHELGHALGLNHTSDYDDVMYYFGYGGDIPGFFGRYRERLTTRDDIANVSGLSPGDHAQLRAVYDAATVPGGD